MMVVGHIPQGDTIVECHQQGVGVPGGDIRERSETVNGISQFSHQECSLRDLLHTLMNEKTRRRTCRRRGYGADRI